MHEEEIATFEALTGSDSATATQYLESCGWCVEDAYNMFSAMGDASPENLASYEGFGAGEETTQLDRDAQMAASLADNFDQPSTGSSATTGGGSVDADGVRAPTEYTTGRLVDDNPFGGLALDDMMRAHPGLMSALGMQGGGIQGGPMGGGPMGGLGQPSQFSSAMNPPKVVDLPDSEYMFPLPEEAKKLNCGGDIAHARQRAREDRKWLIVSLQSFDIFDSHRMIRDVWSNDTIISLLQSSFIFYQRSSSSEQGTDFMRLYSISDNMLPITVIIGPTGSQLYSHTGFISSVDLSSALVEFLDNNDLDSTEAPKPKRERSNSSNTQSQTQSQTQSADAEFAQAIAAAEETVDMDTDDALTAAIAMSLRDETPPLPPTDGVVDITSMLSSASVKDTPAPAAPAQEVSPPTSHLPVDLPAAPPVEPLKGTEGSTRLQLRLSDGKTVVRRFMKTDVIAVIYSIVLENLPEARERAFLLQTPANPAFKLLEVSDQTIAEQDLSNSKLILVWESDTPE